MPHKFIVIGEDDVPSETSADMSAGKMVLFFPTDSAHSVSITFTNDIPLKPFSNWRGMSRKGRKGLPLMGRVRTDILGRFQYKAKSTPGKKGGRPRVQTNPELIVDGGSGEPRVKPKKSRGGKRRTRRK